MTHDDSATVREDLPYAWRVLALNVLVVAQPALTATMLTLAVPRIATAYALGPSGLAVLVSGYWLVSTVLLPTVGGLADTIGRRRLYAAGILVFTAAGAACAAAPSGGALIAARLVQAAGAAAIVANGTALLTDAFPPRLLGTAMGVTGSVFAAFGLAGPVIGGAVASYGGGRAVFWFSVPFGAASLVLSLLVLRGPAVAPAAARTPRRSFDTPGAVLSALALTGLMLVLAQGPSWGWSSPRTLLVAVATAAAAAVFARRELRCPYPLVDLRLFGAWHRSAAYLALGLIAVSDLSISLVMSLFFQQSLGLAPVDAGLRLLPVTAGAIVGAPLAGRLAARVPARVLSSCGAGLHAAALIVLVAVFPSTAAAAGSGAFAAVAAGCLGAIGLGTALFATSNTHSVMASVPADRRGVANALRSTVQNAAGLAGTALVLAVVGGSAVRAGAHAGAVAAPAPFRTALLVLTALCALATAVSITRGRA